MEGVESNKSRRGRVGVGGGILEHDDVSVIVGGDVVRNF